jgi:hypothetical protein
MHAKPHESASALCVCALTFMVGRKTKQRARAKRGARVSAAADTALTQLDCQLQVTRDPTGRPGCDGRPRRRPRPWCIQRTPSRRTNGESVVRISMTRRAVVTAATGGHTSLSFNTVPPGVNRPAARRCRRPSRRQRLRGFDCQGRARPRPSRGAARRSRDAHP